MSNNLIIENLKFTSEQWKNLYYATKAVVELKEREINELKHELKVIYCRK